MNMRDLPMLTLRVRALQEIYADSHAALIHWGDWSWDRRGIFPTLAPPAMWDQYQNNENDRLEDDELPIPIQLPVKAKAEPAPTRDYNERIAVALDERMHGPGGLPDYIRLVARTAYVSREIPEQQFAKLCGCTDDAFCERLEALYVFARRFV